MPDTDVRIREVLFDPPGSEVRGEFVLVENAGPATVDLTGWTLGDTLRHEEGRFVFEFPPFTLDAGHRVRVWTGPGVDDAENLYWGRLLAVWNNVGGDAAVLANRDGNEIDRFAYPAPRPVRTVRILAWNIAVGEPSGFNEPDRLDRIVAVIRQEAPDLVLLNEVGYRWKGGVADEVAELKGRLGYEHVLYTYTSIRRFFPDQKRVAVLSRWPLREVERIEHRAPDFEGKGFATLQVRTHIHGLRHEVFVTRINAADAAENARSHAQLTDRILRLPRDAAVVIGGDFNTGLARWDEHQLPTRHEVPAQYLDLVERTGLRNVLGGLGWESLSPDDHVLFRGPYRIQAAARAAPEPNPSDHPLVTTSLARVEGAREVPFQDGSILDERGDLFVVFGGAKLRVPDWATADRLYPGQRQAAKKLTRRTLKQIPDVPASGTVLQEDGQAEVWWIDGAQRRWIVSPEVLVRHGGEPVVRTAPAGSLAAVPIGPEDTDVPPVWWFQFSGSTIKPSSEERIDFLVEVAPDLTADVVEFVLNLAPGLEWAKELVLNVADPPEQVVIGVDQNNLSSRNGLFRYQLPVSSLALRRDTGPTGMRTVAILGHLTGLPDRARVTFTWLTD